MRNIKVDKPDYEPKEKVNFSTKNGDYLFYYNHIDKDYRLRNPYGRSTEIYYKGYIDGMSEEEYEEFLIYLRKKVEKLAY